MSKYQVGTRSERESEPPKLASGPDSEQAPHEGEIALNAIKNFDTVGWRTAVAGRRAMTRFSPVNFDPGPMALKMAKGLGVFVREEVFEGKATVHEIGNPAQRSSFGFVGGCVRLQSKSSVLSGTLLMPFRADKLGAVARETLRMFIWNEDNRRFEIVPWSGVAQAGDYVWGRVVQPGVYAVIGLNMDPRILRTIFVFKEMKGFIANLGSKEAEVFRGRICQLILCTPGNAVLEANAYGAMLTEQANLGYPGGPPPAALGGGPCETCMGGGGGWPPEVGIIPGTGVPNWPGRGGGFTLAGKPCEHLWESMGPNNLAGCMMDVCVDPSDPHRIYAASANGGIWRATFNASYSQYAWDPLTDDEIDLRTYNVAVAPSDNRILYMVVGEGVPWGAGVLWLSGNAGRSWQETPISPGHISRMVVHPTDSNRVYLAAVTGLYEVDPANGKARNLLMGDVTDLALDPGDPNILYAAVRNHGIERLDSSTGTWTQILSLATAEGLSVGSLAGLKIQVSVGTQGSPGNRRVAVKFAPRRVNATGAPVSDESNFVEIFVLGRPGATGWARVGPLLIGWKNYPDWVNAIAIDPHNDNIMLVGGEKIARTDDGGQHWIDTMLYRSTSPNGHEDQHRIVFDPANRGVAYAANDGGIWRSTDSGANWSSVNDNLTTMQFFHFGVTATRAVSNAFHWGELASLELAQKRWVQIDGGSWENINVVGDDKRPDIFYYMTATGMIRRQFTATGAAGWDTYIDEAVSYAIDTRPASNVVLVGGVDHSVTPSRGRIRRTSNGDQPTPAWTTDNIANGISLDNDRVVRICFAPSEPAKAYALTETAPPRILRRDNVDDAMGSWQLAGTMPSGPSSLTHLAVNVFDSQRVYVVAYNGVWRSANGGSTWTQIASPARASIPSGQFENIVPSPRYGFDIFLATHAGVFYSPDDGLHWFPIHDGLPNAQIFDMHWKGDYLYAATHGRGLWRCKPYG